MLSYVGELWNYADLRDDLARAGHAFETSGDTEVLAAALSEWGIEALNHLDGMFCFAWTSPREGVIVRDRFGKIPLYTLRAPGLVAWASERKAFGSLAGAAEALPPAHAMDLRTGVARRYYAIPDVASDLPAQELDEIVHRAVRKRLVTSDVPVCVLLSGGLDSSLITAIAASIRPDVVAYTCHVDPGSEDAEAARDMAKVLGVELREVAVAAPSDLDLSAAIGAVELSNPTAVEIAALCLPLAERIAADGFKVALTGESADELFGGYGNLCRHARTDLTWRAARRVAFERQGRINFVRVNKAFMAHGVEPRMPFCEREIVERALGLGVSACPPGKGLLRAAASRWLPERICRREKVAFQVGAGASSSLAGRLGAGRVRAYNDIARGMFGMLAYG